MASDIIFDSSSPIITINQSSLVFKINQNNFQAQSQIPQNSKNLTPLSQTEILLTNLTSSYVAYRSRITKKKLLSSRAFSYDSSSQFKYYHKNNIFPQF